METTFEELILSHPDNHFLASERKIISDLLQQVREVTIAECKKIYEEDWGKYTGYKKMESLPTNRIKIDE